MHSMHMNHITVYFFWFIVKRKIDGMIWKKFVHRIVTFTKCKNEFLFELIPVLKIHSEKKNFFFWLDKWEHLRINIWSAIKLYKIH